MVAVIVPVANEVAGLDAVEETCVVGRGPKGLAVRAGANVVACHKLKRRLLGGGSCLPRDNPSLLGSVGFNSRCGGAGDSLRVESPALTLCDLGNSCSFTPSGREHAIKLCDGEVAIRDLVSLLVIRRAPDRGVTPSVALGVLLACRSYTSPPIPSMQWLE